MEVVEAHRENLNWHFAWELQKWEQDKCEFAAKKMRRRGQEYMEVIWGDGRKIVPVTAEHMESRYLLDVIGAPDELLVIEGNLLLNEGIARLLDLLIAAGGTSYNNANAYIGVGTSSTAESASQTDLQAGAFYKAMNSTYPSRASQTVTWQSDFTSAEANQAWAEWSIAAGATSASGAGFTVGTTNLNRKVQGLGTKATGTWTLSGAVTIS